MLRRDFHFGAHTFRVEGGEEALGWLQRFLEPQLAAGDSDSPHEVIRLIVDAREHARLAACGPHPDDLAKACFTLDSGIVTGRVWDASDSAEVVFDEARDIFYRRRPDEPGVIDIIVAGDTAEARVALMRAVREYAMLYAARAGWLIVHAAAVCMGNDAFVIAGPKKAGKTTLLLHALQNERGTYVSNDRVAVRADAPRPIVHGIPTIVSIRPDASAWFPELGPKLRGVRFDARPPVSDGDVPAGVTPVKAWSLSPRQFCNIVGAKSRAAARVVGLLFPQVDASTPGVTFELLGTDEARRALQAALFRSCPADGMFRVHRAESPSDSDTGMVAGVTSIISAVPSFACRLGADAYRDGTRWLSHLLETAAPGSQTS
jgi:hypothetical protein